MIRRNFPREIPTSSIKSEPTFRLAAKESCSLSEHQIGQGFFAQQERKIPPPREIERLF